MSTTQTEPRQLIKVSPGWYVDAADQDGPKVRKADGDVIIEAPTGSANGASAEKSAPQITELSSGKSAVGRTVTIQCAWVDPDQRVDTQKRQFAGPTKGIAFDKVQKAAGDETAAQPCGRERVIKAQDEFQVRFCPEHTKLRRNELRRQANAAKAAAAKKAGTKR